jgi:hypothetical protein
MKVIPDTHLIRDVLANFARACGEALAKAHARSGDPEVIDAYLGRNDAFTNAMNRFARTYADRNEADHAELFTAVARGDITKSGGCPVDPMRPGPGGGGQVP